MKTFKEWFSGEFLNCKLDDVSNKEYWEDVVSYAQPAWDYQQAKLDKINNILNSYNQPPYDKQAHVLLKDIWRVVNDTKTN